MSFFNDSRVKMYLSSLGEADPIRNVRTICQCHIKDLPENAHNETATPYDTNLIKIAIRQERTSAESIKMYITKKSYFSFDTMHLLIYKMFCSKDIHSVLMYYSLLETNFFMHPPCARYMAREYYNLMLGNTDYFRGLPLWNFLIKRLDHTSRGFLLYGKNEVDDLAFKKHLIFCVNVLQMDSFTCNKIRVRSLMVKCVNSHLGKENIMYTIKKLLDMSFNRGYDFQVPIINLALLLERL